MVTKNIYDLECKLKKTTDALHQPRRFEYPWVYSCLAPLSREDIILDAGAGDTVFRYLLSPSVGKVVSIDIDRESINWAEEIKYPNVTAVFGNLTKIPYPSNYFTKSYCISVLEHLPKSLVQQAIRELIRVTSGMVAITMDIGCEKTDKQVDIEDFRNIMETYTIVPPYPSSVLMFSINRTSPLFTFVVACILVKK